MQIRIPPTNLSLQGTTATATGLARLVDGHPTTNNERHMWLCNIPASPAVGVLVIKLPMQPHAASLRVWNYNQAGNLQKYVMGGI